jgi:hypothetical protein
MKLAGLVVVFAAALWAQPGVEGTWQGTLQTPSGSLRLGLHITRNAQGLLTSTLDSIDQGAMGLPVQETTFSNLKFHFNMPNLQAEYEGTLSSDGAEITGTF